MLRLSVEDKAILAYVSFCGRAPIAQIAKELHLRERKVRSIFDKLLTRDFIYPQIRVNVRPLGLQHFDVWCTLTPNAARDIPTLLRKLSLLPSISWIALYCGHYDLMLGFSARDEDEVEATLAKICEDGRSVFSETCCLKERFW